MMPKLVRLYVKSMAIGFGLSVGFTGFLIWQDVAGLAHLIASSDLGAMAAVMLIVFNGIVFSAAQFGVAVMGLTDDGGQDGGLRDHAALIKVPAPLSVASRRGRQD